MTPSKLKTRRSGFVEALATVLGGQIACGAAALAIEICYARFLGPAGRGQLSLCLMAAYTLVRFAGLGGEIPISMWTADPARRPQGWLRAVAMCGLMGCFVTGVVWSGLYWKWRPSFLRGITPALATLILVSVPLTVALAYLVATLNGQERFRTSASLAIACQLTELAGVVVLILLMARTAEIAFLGYVIGLLVGVSIALVVGWDFIRSAWNGSPTLKSFGAALSLGVRGQLGNVATLFNYRLDVFIVNAFLSTAQLGLYSLGVVVSEALWQIPHAAAVALFPRTARTLEQGATEFTCTITRQVLIISLACGVALAVVSPFAVPLVFGTRFSASVSVIWWILPGTVALSLAKVMSADLAARGKPEYSSICSFISLAATVALDLTLIPRMGIQGAALASSLAYLLHTILVATALKRVLGVPWRLLLVPSRAEWASYQHAWSQIRLWLHSVSVRPINANSDV